MKRILSVAAILLLAISCENVNEVEIIEDIHDSLMQSGVITVYQEMPSNIHEIINTQKKLSEMIIYLYKTGKK